MTLSTILLAVAASTVSVMAQGSIGVNPTVAQADITVEGTDWLWAAFAIMLASAIGVFAWSFMVPRTSHEDMEGFFADELVSAGHRAFHWIGIAILLTASTAYFSMASDLGAVAIDVEFVRYKDVLYVSDLKSSHRIDLLSILLSQTGNANPYTRSIWYVRYIDWSTLR